MDKDKNKDPKKIKVLDWSECPEPFKPVFENWITYKAQKGQKYVQAGLNALFRQKIMEFKTINQLAAAIEHSMANNYDGIYPVKSGAAKPVTLPANMQEPEL